MCVLKLCNAIFIIQFSSYFTDIGDIDKEMPGFLDATREWFRIYKMPTGKPPNQFAFDGKFQDKVKL